MAHIFKNMNLMDEILRLMESIETHPSLRIVDILGETNGPIVLTDPSLLLDDEVFKNKIARWSQLAFSLFDKGNGEPNIDILTTLGKEGGYCHWVSELDQFGIRKGELRKGRFVYSFQLPHTSQPSRKEPIN